VLCLFFLITLLVGEQRASGYKHRIVGEVGISDDVTGTGDQAQAQEEADKEIAMQPQYTDDEKAQIAISQVTDIGKAHNGSIQLVKAGGKEEDMVDEYVNATKQQAAQKDVNRMQGNAATVTFALTKNKSLKEIQEKAYETRDRLTRSFMNATMERYINATNEVRLEHAAACKQLLAANPYPANSRQHDAVNVACKDEDPRNLDAGTVEPPGMRDMEYGPYETQVPPDPDIESTLTGSNITSGGEEPPAEAAETPAPADSPPTALDDDMLDSALELEQQLTHLERELTGV